MDYIFNNEPTRKAFKCFKMVNISIGGDATVSDSIRLDAVITATLVIFNRILIAKEQDDTEKSVVTNCNSFLDGNKAVDRIKTPERS